MTVIDASLRSRLREATAPAHRRLEAALDLSAANLRRDRLIALLGRFHGFHAGWEPALRRVVPASIAGPRLKLSLLQDDLRRLGLDETTLRALPVCADTAVLCASEAAAAGSLYVLEGSTLGGQILQRSLRTHDWYPAEGLRYWNPYGAHTGQRWHETVSYLEARPARQGDETVNAAVSTFVLLESWLLAGLPARADVPA